MEDLHGPHLLGGLEYDRQQAASDSGRLEEGERFTFCLRPFSVPVTVRPKIVEVIPKEKVVWTGSKFGIFSRHEFVFKQASNGVLVTSRETFRGLQLLLARRTFPRKTIRELTIDMLLDLKKAAEKEEPTGGRGDGEARGTGKAEHE